MCLTQWPHVSECGRMSVSAIEMEWRKRLLAVAVCQFLVTKSQADKSGKRKRLAAQIEDRPSGNTHVYTEGTHTHTHAGKDKN